jgi:predicted dehydrogenase
MTQKINWGVMGCGGIAGKFASDLPLTKYGRLAAVGSRSNAKAQKFAAQHGAARAYGSYEELAADPEVDIVYVATPHPCHMENTLLAIAHGKHVLCEKPFALNAKQTRRMIAAAQKKGVFLMEAMWARFFPALAQIRTWIAQERIGTVFAVEADFGIHFKIDPEHRILNPELGGGALLDLGIYPVSFASMVYGTQPEKIVSVMHKAATGVDDQAVLAFEYPDGATATLSTASRVALRNEARIFGAAGTIIVHPWFFFTNRLTLQVDGKKEKVFHFPYPGIGLHFEAEHVHHCLRKGKRESDIMPLNETAAIMQTLDRIRKQWKLRYPGE